jgi:hypothetical protein
MGRAVLTELLVAFGIGVLTMTPAAAQEAAKPAAATKGTKPFTPKKLSDGQPDIQGIYISGWSLPYEVNSAEEHKAYKARMEAVRGPDPGAYGLEWTELSLRGRDNYTPKDQKAQVTDPPNGKIPYQPWAQAKRMYIRDNPYERAEFIDSRVRCLPAGPRFVMTSAYNGWQILQPPGYVIMLQEHNHNYRIIPIDNTPHVGKDLQLWQGDSRGYWEGSTLVIDVTNFNDKSWIVGEAGGEGISTGAFFSTALHMVERFTIVDENNVDYEATIEDPNVFTRPWKMKFGVWRRAPTTYENFEYACHEGNRSIELTEVLFKDNQDGKAVTPAAPAKK